MHCMYGIPILKPHVATSICDSHEISNTYNEPRNMPILKLPFVLVENQVYMEQKIENWQYYKKFYAVSIKKYNYLQFS